MKKERPKDTNTDFSKFTDINLKTSYLIVIVRYYMKKKYLYSNSQNNYFLRCLIFLQKCYSHISPYPH